MALIDDLNETIGKVGDIAERSVQIYNDVIGDIQGGGTKSPPAEPQIQQSSNSEPDSVVNEKPKMDNRPMIILAAVVIGGILLMRSR